MPFLRQYARATFSCCVDDRNPEPVKKNSDLDLLGMNWRDLLGRKNDFLMPILKAGE